MAAASIALAGRRQSPPGRLCRRGRRHFDLSRHAADPPLRGEGGPAVRHGPDRRLLPPLYRAGGGRGRDEARGARDRPVHRVLSSPRPSARLRRRSARGHGGNDRAARRLFRRQGRLDAHVRAGLRYFTAAMASSAPRPRSGRGSPSPTPIAATAGSASASSATARRIRARSRKASTWRRAGACRSSSSSKTTAPSRPAPVPNRSVLAHRGAAFDIPGESIDGMCVEAVREAAARAIARARSGAGPAILEMRTERYRGHSLADPPNTAQGRGARRAGAGPGRARARKNPARWSCRRGRSEAARRGSPRHCHGGGRICRAEPRARCGGARKRRAAVTPNGRFWRREWRPLC